MEQPRLSLIDVIDACLIIDLRVFRLKPQETSIGRKMENDCVINHSTVSRNHARIVREDGNFVLYDLNSTVGTFVNNIRVDRKILRTGDIILLGSYPMMFMYEDPETIQKHEKGTGLLSPMPL
ncbi:MAG: FHA domain-containing protein [Anaerolineales bacterium]|nr:FHA domain-containing protein [Anaerolineales bacterium]